ncbi:protocatechuate 3,4-dioxygenase subunit alpha [Micromonospora sp. ATA51]|uniref:protocatechuate 3,4-dioxygenase subunit alpha n=1 Tax=Micromonospora sp. ATA51 TaxID=2806098 RepID=UPI001A52A84B|nr:protocatechuate 3,4-dioxygenase subunit alpha [Micromonospora sp. ATA51]MBM0229002.1 protocatechuate 3,4-dioxygenase subunit alpha [Micromonospora sp. ATA51]
MATDSVTPAGRLAPTPSQTVGPFYGYALPFAGGGDVAPLRDPRTITLHGRVYDGAGQPVPDALLEFWQTTPDGTTPRMPGSLRRDPVTGAVAGRNGVDFTGFGRVPTDADGHYVLHTLPPGARPGAAPYLAVCLFARGLLHHLFTRIYLPEYAEANAADPVLAALEPPRRDTLIATAERERTYRFDIRIQAGSGPHEETVFLEFS